MPRRLFDVGNGTGAFRRCPARALCWCVNPPAAPWLRFLLPMTSSSWCSIELRLLEESMFRRVQWPAFAVVACVVFSVVLSVAAQAPAGRQETAPPAATPPPTRPAQSTPATPGAETAGQSTQFKNIKVLKDIPAD